MLIPPLLKKLCEVKFLTIQLPVSVPPSVLKSFLVMIPALIILMSAGIIQFILVRYAKVDLFTFIYQVKMCIRDRPYVAHIQYGFR